MKLKKFINGRGLKYLNMVLIGLAAVLLISSSISSNLYNAKCSDQLGKLSDAFNNISDELEFNGYSNAVQDKIKNYSMLYKQKANVIITDKEGKVLYNLNNAYMPEKGLFYTAYKKGTRYVDIIDSQQNTIYTALLDYSFNNNGKQGIAINKNMEMIANRIKSIPLEPGTEQFMEDEKMASERATVYMDSVLISSKGYSLYSISAYNSADLVWNDKSNKIYRDIVNILGPISAIIIFFFWLLLPIWVFVDAQKRGFKAPLWTLLVLLTNVIGLLVYLVVRPEYVKCRKCRRQLSTDFVNCPYCGTRNKDLCSSCSQILEEDWAACPNCGRFKDSEPAPDISE